MKDVTKSAGWPANYPAFTDRDDDASAPAEAGFDASRVPPPQAAAAPAGTPAGLLGRFIDVKLVLLILLVGVPFLAFCILFGR